MNSPKICIFLHCREKKKKKSKVQKKELMCSLSCDKLGTKHLRDLSVHEGSGRGQGTVINAVPCVSGAQDGAQVRIFNGWSS